MEILKSAGFNYLQEKGLLLKNLGKDIMTMLAENKAYIAGGALTSVFSRRRINDFDIYFRGEPYLRRVQGRLTDSFNFKVLGCAPCAITLKDDSGRMIQLIKNFYMEPEDNLKRFDFTVCMAAYDPGNDGMFYMADNFMRHLAQKRLVFNMKTRYPIASLVRVKKFMKREFIISATELLKMSLAINRIAIKTYKDLREQMLGVDTIMLKNLTEQFEKMDGGLDKVFEVEEFIQILEEYLDKVFAGEDDSN